MTAVVILLTENMCVFVFLAFAVETNENDTENKSPEEAKKEPATMA